MRKIVAKSLREHARSVSGPTERKVKWYKKLLKKGDEDHTVHCGTHYCTGYRRAYQDLKKAYKSMKQQGRLQ